MTALDTVRFTLDDTFPTPGQYEAELLAILDDGATVEIKMPADFDQADPDRVYWIDTADLDPQCECGNPFRLCHPEA